MPHHLAQINVAKMIAPLDSPLMADFLALIDPVNRIADETPGFVWRMDGATALRPFGDPLILVNYSIWESVEALRAFVYRSGHIQPLRDRARWFEKPREAHLAMWWIPAGYIPSLEKACDRLRRLRAVGDSADAFSFSNLFPAPPPREGETVLEEQSLCE